MISQPIYTERISAKFFAGIFGVLVLLLLFILVRQTFSAPVESDPAPTWVILILVIITSAFAINFRYLSILITKESVTAGYGIFSREIPWENIESCYLDQTTALRYGGFGIRIAIVKGKWRLVYNTIGPPRVVLSLKTGRFREFVFSTNNPEEVLSIINDRISAS